MGKNTTTMSPLYDVDWSGTQMYDQLDYPDGYVLCAQRGSWLHLTIKPIVYSLGVVGIVLTVVVLSRKTMCT